MLHMVFSIESGDVRSSESRFTRVAQQIQAPEVTVLAQWRLGHFYFIIRRVWVVYREKLRRALLSTVATSEAFDMKNGIEGSHELTGDRKLANVTGLDFLTVSNGSVRCRLAVRLNLSLHLRWQEWR